MSWGWFIVGLLLGAIIGIVMLIFFQNVKSNNYDDEEPNSDTINICGDCIWCDLGYEFCIKHQIQVSLLNAACTNYKATYVKSSKNPLPPNK